jgi:Zn-dependent protease with chaperone function
MPLFIQKLWGCEPFEQSEKIRVLKTFLTEMGFKYRGLLRWPIFEGRMMTAGIMGIVPRFRYILVTDSLLEILTTQELKAVMAHEAGHAKYRHLLFYIFFFIGYMVLSFGIFDILFSLIATNPFFARLLHGDNPQSINLFYLSLAIPLLITIIVYFRFIMGFFMRNFERQADLYSAVVMGSPEPTISSLEKIALMSGKSRDIPSWHHFSIKQRVEFLLNTIKNPGLVNSHNRFIRFSFIVYIVCVICLAYLLNFSEVKRDYEYKIVTNMLNRQLEEDPNNTKLLQSLALLYHEMEMLPEAAQIYDRMLSLNMNHAVALNNLAWLLITTDDESLRDPPRALELAQRAVELDRLSIYLDTLAEAYYVNGNIDKAIETIKEALSIEKGDKSYFNKQLKKFMEANVYGD